MYVIDAIIHIYTFFDRDKLESVGIVNTRKSDVESFHLVCELWALHYWDTLEASVTKPQAYDISVS